MFKDAYELDVTCDNDAAMQAYLSGTDCSLRFDQPAIDQFTTAIAHDEEFALAHAALSRQLFIHGFREESAKHFKLALSLKERVTRREQDAIDVAAAAASFDPQALAMAQSHVASYPNDVFILAHLLGPFGMLAFSGTTDWPEQNAALLKATRPHYPADDWWHMTSRGFFGAEQGMLAQAREDCERAWSISENGNCAHSVAHMHFEAGALDEGRSFINEWLTKHGAHSNMRHHLVWHLSFLDLESGRDMSQVLQIYDRELDPEVNDPTPLETLCDNASFLWRCHLSDVEIPLGNLREMLAYAEDHFGHCGFAFADLHRALLTALQAGSDKHKDMVNQLSDFSAESATRAAEFVCRTAKGLGAFANRDYADAVRILEPVSADSILVGGSNPQRRIVEETLVEACIRAGENNKASAILRRRNRECSIFDQNLLRRIGNLDTSH